MLIGTEKRRRTKRSYSIGDVVRISDYGHCYDTYSDAMFHFGIIGGKNVIKDTNYPFSLYRIKLPDLDRNSNWVIIGKALHGSFEKEYVYCLKNAYGDYMLSGNGYFELRENINTPFIKKLKEKKKDYIPQKIIHGKV